MPNTWGRGKKALLLGPEGGALAGIDAGLASVGFQVLQEPGAADPSPHLDDASLGVVYLDGERLSGALDRVRELHARRPGVPTVVVKSAPAATDVADAMRAGVNDFLPAGAPAATVLARLHELLDDTARKAAASDEAVAGSAGLVGASSAIRRVYKTVERVARFKTSVLILGESGTGKELIARALHLAGPRRQQAFVPVNCATLGRDLLENELFGHERGAFTGAHAKKPGLFEVADGGTLFLDEIGEMDGATQAKLLRVLERSEFRRVGGTAKLRVDVSVVAATNQDLRNAIAVGRFREDLFYRLNVVTIAVPPLRERREDIPALVDAFIGELNRRHGGHIRGVTPEAMRRLTASAWPGNVRELKNAIASAVMLADGDVLDEHVLDEALAMPAWLARPADVRAVARVPVARVAHGAPAASAGAPAELRVKLPATVADVERELILETVRSAGGRRAAARHLGIGLRTLYAKLRAYDADRA